MEVFISAPMSLLAQSFLFGFLGNGHDPVDLTDVAVIVDGKFYRRVYRNRPPSMEHARKSRIVCLAIFESPNGGGHNCPIRSSSDA
jgi:hypothetical protein